VQPLALARLRALVPPAAAELKAATEGPACRALDQEIDELIAVPSGVRMGEPEWLEAVEEEVDRLAAASRQPPVPARSPEVAGLTPDEVEAQWQRWEQELAK
jgi:hypothetical protein